MTTLPQLYKPTKTNAIQTCIISYDGPNFTVEWGQLGGKMQSKSTECFTTNSGRANERTPTQQAEFEALALHTKKIKSGYSTNVEAPTTVQLPMKVKCYQDQIKNVKLPCRSTEKLNGVNGLYRRDADNNLTLYSRGGEVYPPIPHLTQHVLDIMDELNSNELNGELYIYRTPLQDIQSAVKKPNELSPRLTFNVFDICDSPETYKYRNLKLSALYSTLESIDHVSLQYIGFLTGIECSSHKQLDAHYNQCMAMGLEGTVIKNLDGLYEYNVRSSNQFKYKKAQDAEFRVVGFNLDKNKHAVYQCITADGKQFSVKRKGTNEERLADTYNAPDNIGRWLTVEFEEYSKPEPGHTVGTPLKPVGLNFRECNELDGTPIE